MSAKRLSIISLAIAAAFGSTVAIAGGPDMPSCQPALNTGFYLGAGPNYGFGTSMSNFGTATKFRQGMRGWGGDLYAGWDTVLLHRFYMGLNTFIMFNDINSKGDIGNQTGHVRLDYIWGLDAEPGYVPADNVHLFARVGVANGWMEIEDSAGTKNDFSHFGLMLGLGSEVGVGDNFGIRLTYTYYDFGKKQSGNPEAIVRPYFGISELSLNYHFAQ
jgi:opacity protein-like surface antigen